MKSLLYHEEFPSNGWVNEYKFEFSRLTREQNNEVTILIKNYLSELSKFYAQEKSAFFNENKSFYQAAAKEYMKQIPSGITDVMEQFYGEKFNSYTILISPIMMWPISDNEGRGIGADVTLKSDLKTFTILRVRLLKLKKQANLAMIISSRQGFKHS